MPQVVAALYRFTRLEDYRELREPLLSECLAAGLRGTFLLAGEGINGTIAGSREAVDQVLTYLRRDPRLQDLTHRETRATQPPFQRMKVKLKKEIVTMGVAGIDPVSQPGGYVEPADWNELVNDDDVLLLDTRNSYETSIGSFRGALRPATTNFREFPEFVQRNLDPTKHSRIAMFCTGGIRCEKAAAFMLEQGFDEVLKLRGGILNYLAEIPPQQSAWEGECFVFDGRVALNHRLDKGRYDQCHACRHPITAQDRQSPLYRQGVSCPACHGRLTDVQKARFAERRKQVELARLRREKLYSVNASNSRRYFRAAE
ncbi:MAG: rhodanese-related sulfurtransferase [Halieaceae bacterium]|nr:rhodanese-related sulfurtransferase [Halieaceae bacterium]